MKTLLLVCSALSTLGGNPPPNSEEQVLQQSGVVVRKFYLGAVLFERDPAPIGAGYYLTVPENWRGDKSEIEKIASLKDLREISIYTDKYNASWSLFLGGHSSLESLIIPDRMTDECLKRYEKSRLLYLHIPFSPITDVGMQSVAKIRSLKGLNLSATKITDKGLSHLSDLITLEVLRLECTNIKGPGLNRLSQLTKLRKLRIPSGAATNLEFCRRFDQLEDLEATGVSLIRPGIEVLANLPKLKYLELRSCGVTDADFEHIANSKSLSEVHVDGSALTSRGISALAKNNNIQTLDVSFSNVDDTAVDTLITMRRLESFACQGTKITLEAKAKLRSHKIEVID